jgi:hypothetical protein
MQGENETPCDFLRRTDYLAEKLGITLDDLPDLLGFSRASLFGYRMGKRSITRKAWLKLTEAEKAAGLLEDAAPKQEPDRMDLMDARLTRIEQMLKDLMETMAKTPPPADVPKTSSGGRGKKFA